MKSTVKHRQGMSTNAKACYDKLGEKVVALLWFDECAQSVSLSFFSFSWPGIQSNLLSFFFKADPAERLTPSDYTSPSPFHCPFTDVSIKGLVCSAER